MQYLLERDQISEAAIEKGVVLFPSLFLRRELQLIERQPTFGNRRPDLFFRDQIGLAELVEIARRGDVQHARALQESRVRMRQITDERRIHGTLICMKMDDACCEELVACSLNSVVVPEDRMRKVLDTIPLLLKLETRFESGSGGPGPGWPDPGGSGHGESAGICLCGGSAIPAFDGDGFNARERRIRRRLLQTLYAVNFDFKAAAELLGLEPEGLREVARLYAWTTE